MDYALAHFNMIEQQVRPWDVLDARTLDVMTNTPRHLYVPDGYESLAYSEMPIPLSENNIMLEPKIVGRFVQAANPQENEQVLEIGTGSGYQTAILAQMSHHVDSIEQNEKLAQQAAIRLTQQGHDNVKVMTGNAMQADLHNQYDIIILNAAVVSKPQFWLDKLAVGGRCVAVVGQNAAMQAICYTRQENNQWTEDILFETEIAYLEGEQQPALFAF